MKPENCKEITKKMKFDLISFHEQVVQETRILLQLQQILVLVMKLYHCKQTEKKWVLRFVTTTTTIIRILVFLYYYVNVCLVRYKNSLVLTTSSDHFGEQWQDRQHRYSLSRKRIEWCIDIKNEDEDDVDVTLVVFLVYLIVYSLSLHISLVYLLYVCILTSCVCWYNENRIKHGRGKEVRLTFYSDIPWLWGWINRIWRKSKVMTQ